MKIRNKKVEKSLKIIKLFCIDFLIDNNKKIIKD
jgi:hypothetical protein